MSLYCVCSPCVVSRARTGSRGAYEGQILATKQIDLKAGGIGCTGNDGAWVYADARDVTRGFLMEPLGVGNIVYVENAQVVNKALLPTTGQADQHALLAPAGDKDEGTVSAFGKVSELEVAFSDVAEGTLFAGTDVSRELVDIGVEIAGVGELEEAAQIHADD